MKNKYLLNKVFVPFRGYKKNIGGPITFMANLQNYMNKNKIGYTNYYIFNKASLILISYDLRFLKLNKAVGTKIVQRLDGIYYPSRYGKLYKENNELISKIYNDYSDFVIFQSEYCRKQCFEMLGAKISDKYKIIINGVDENIFYPKKLSHKLRNKIKFVTTGNIRHSSMLYPLLNALDFLKRKLDFELNIVGPVYNNEFKRSINREYLVYHGEKTLKDTAEVLRQCDIFLYSFINPPCPNSVIEAVSVGLPVVGFNSGSMSEILFFSKDLLAEVSDKLFQDEKDMDPKELAKKIEFTVQNYNKYKKLSFNNSKSYSFDVCGKEYVNVFNKLM